MKIYLSPIRLLTYYLIALVLIGSLSQAGSSLNAWIIQLRNFVLLFGGAYAVYQSLLFFKRTSPTRLEHRIITSCILFLLFFFDQPWYVFLGLGISVELLQRFIRLPTGPIMNPAGLVSLIATFLGFYPAWWGTNFSPRLPLISGGISAAMLLTLPLGLYIAYKYKKLWIVGSFLIAFALSYLLILQSSPIFIIVEGTLAFFTLVMAIEPKSSPVLRNQQLVYGISLGILISFAIKINFPETYLGSLVLCNLLFNLYGNRKMLMTKFHKPTPIAPATPLSPPATWNATINA